MTLLRNVIAFCLIILFVAGCGKNITVSSSNADAKTIEITDSIGRSVRIPASVTSAAVANAYNVELITAIGASDAIKGVDYNIYQDQAGFKNRFTENEVIGKNQRELNYEKIIELNPQVLILTGNGDWDVAQKKLEPFGIKVIVCDSYYTDQFFNSVRMLGVVFGKQSRADELCSYFQSKLDYIEQRLENIEKKRVYFEYRNPGNTTVPGDYFYKMVEYAGGDNLFKDSKATKINLEEVVNRNPEYIVKVSETKVYSSYLPPTSEDMQRIMNEIRSRPGWDEINAVKNNHVLLLSHYVHGGAAKLVGTMYIAKFLYPDQLSELHPEEIFKTWVTKYQGLDYVEGHTCPAFSFEE